MSASCSSVATCYSLIVFSSTRSLIKWCLMSICLVLLCWIGFLEMLIVLRLSQYNVITSCVTLYSVSIYFIQIIWEQLLPAAMYSASAIERDTQFCFLLNQETRLFPKKKRPTEVLFYHQHFHPNQHHNNQSELVHNHESTASHSCRFHLHTSKFSSLGWYDLLWDQLGILHILQL